MPAPTAVTVYVVAAFPVCMSARSLNPGAEPACRLYDTAPKEAVHDNVTVRPAVCANYPHLHRNFRSRLWQAIDNADTCPIVYNVLERLKQRLGFVKP